LWGGACDRRGRRKPFLLIGFLGSGIALLAMAASRTMSEFYLANLLAGFLGAASGPAGTVLLMETSKREDWPARLAIMSRMTATGWVAGLALGILWLAAGPGSGIRRSSRSTSRVRSRRSRCTGASPVGSPHAGAGRCSCMVASDGPSSSARSSSWGSWDSATYRGWDLWLRSTRASAHVGP